MSITCCHSVCDILKDKLSFVIPALFINISGQPPNSSQTEFTNFSISSCFEISNFLKIIPL